MSTIYVHLRLGFLKLEQDSFYSSAYLKLEVQPAPEINFYPLPVDGRHLVVVSSWITKSPQARIMSVNRIFKI